MTVKSDNNRPPSAPGRAGRLDRTAQNEIGRQLKALYDEVVNEPVPERFVELLQRLDSGEAGKGR